MSKLRRLFLGCAVSSLALLPVPSRSATVCIDPGHGGETGARCANGYSEDYLALYTARLLYCDYWNHLAPWTYGIDAVFTRLTNEAPTYQYRVDVARANNAQVFLSLHANSDGAAYSMVEYDTTAIQHQRNLWTRSLVAANFVAYEVCSNYSQTRGLACHGAVLDETIVRPDSVKHLYVLRNNYVPAVLNEPFGILTAAGAAYCADADSTMLTGASERSALGLGLEYGIADFLGSGPHAPLFAPEGADQEVLLAWSESDPTRVISYVLERADNCWGPWCALAVVASGDALYTTDGIHYAYHDHTVQYARPYWYRFSSVDGQSIESGTPTGLASASLPSAPSGLVAEGEELQDGSGRVSLSWVAGGGSISGYHVYSSTLDDSARCGCNYTWVCDATSCSAVDSLAPVGMQLYYWVAAFNGTGAGPVSNRGSTSITPTVAVSASAAPQWRGLRCAPNPVRSWARFRIGVGEPSKIEVALYDIMGRRVGVPVRSTVSGAGVYEYEWNGSLAGGTRAQPGVYWARLSCNGRVAEVRHLVVVR